MVKTFFYETDIDTSCALCRSSVPVCTCLYGAEKEVLKLKIPFPSTETFTIQDLRNFNDHR